MFQNKIDVGQAAVILSIVNGIRRILPMNPWNIYQDVRSFSFRCERQIINQYGDGNDGMRNRFQYQSEASVRQPHPHVGHLQLEPNNFSERVPPTNPQLDFQPPDGTMVRDRRVWQTESHPEAFSPRSSKNHRRRKSHLDDVYGPNFEEFKEREYRKGRYVKWEQSGHRNSTLRSIKRVPLKKFEFSNKSERDISPRSAVSSDNKKQYILSTDNNKNKTNYNKGCDSKKRSSDIPEKSNSTNTNVSAKASNIKNMNDKVKKTPESEVQKQSLNLEEIKCNDVKTAKVFDHDRADFEKKSNSSPAPFPSSVNTVGIIHSKRQTSCTSSKVDKIEENKQTSTKSLVEPDGDKISDLKRTNVDLITENNSSDSIVKLVSSEKDIVSDEETVFSNDFISIDKIDTTKSFLECFPSDDYRVIDMEVDSPSPVKKSKTGSPNNLTETQCKNVYPEINCDQLLNELNKAIDDSNNVINNVEKGKTEDKTECKIKPCSKNLSDERMKGAKCSKEHTDGKLEKPRSDRKNNGERRKSTSNKMSSLFYPGLANYTIPKKICEKKTRFSDTDEPYMNKMQSLFGIEEDNEDAQKPTESMNNKGDSKSNQKKRLSTDEGHSQNKKRCTDTKTARSSRGSVEKQTKQLSKLVEEKSKSNKNSKRIVDNTKTSILTNTTRCKASEGRRSKTNQGNELTESRLPKESTESKKQREPSTKTIRKSEANHTKSATENNNAVGKKTSRKHLKIMDNKRRNSETPSPNTKLITKRRHSLQLNSSTDARQNEKLLEKLQTKTGSKETIPENDIVKLLEKHTEKINAQVKLICDKNNSKHQKEKVIAEHLAIDISTNSNSEEPRPLKECTAANSEPPTLDNTMKQIKSRTDLDEISSALSKIFESETPIVESTPQLMISSDKESTSKAAPKEICSVLKQLQEPMTEEEANNTSHFQIKNTDKKTTHDIATTSNVLPSKPLEIGETSSKCLNLDSTNSADETGKPNESSEKMPSDITGSSVAPTGASVAPFQQLCSLSKILNSNENEEEKEPIDKVQDKSDDIEPKPIVDFNDDKTILPILKAAPLVKTAVKSELFLTSENCCPLAVISLPQFQRVQSCIVFSDCSEKATIMEYPDVEQSLGLIRNEKCLAVDRGEEIVEVISDNDDQFDDVIEIKPNIPVIDLTKESSDVNTAKVDSKADLLGLLEEGFDRREKITIYRSDETSNNSLEVQAMSASIAPINILGTNTNEEIRSDIDETKVTVAKVEPNGLVEPSESESNQNTDSTEEGVSLAFAQNVRALVSQLVDSESHDNVSDEICQNEETVTPQESTETIETAVVEMVRPAVENSRSESIIPDKTNEVLFIHPESVDQTSKKTANQTDSRRNSQPNTLASNNVQTSSLHVTNQIVGQKENDSNHITQLLRFVYPNGSHRNVQENRLNEAQVMEPVVRNEETNQMTQSHTSRINMPELAFGNRSLIHNIQQSPCRADINSNPSIFNFQNAGTVEDSLAVYHLTQQEYLISNVIVPYIHLMACIRRSLADHTENLKKNLSFLPELSKIELKLAENIYMNKLQIYSEYMVNRLKFLDLTRNMSSVTAHATIELIFQTIRKVNQAFTKTSTILFLKHLMKPQESFYERFPYLRCFYSVIKVFSMEIVRRASVTSEESPCQQMSPDQRKLLEYQIQQFLKILNTERCKRQRIARLNNRENSNQPERQRNERLNRENINQPVAAESNSFSLANRPMQTNVSKNQVAERTSASKSFSTNEGQTGAVTNFPVHLPVAFRSPAHRPEGFMNSPAHVSSESNIMPMNGVVSNYPAHLSASRSPAHRSEGILPQTHSQRISNNAAFMPSPFRSPAHRPEDRQLPATLRSPSHRPEGMEPPAYSTITNPSITGTVQLPEMLRSPSNIPKGIQQPASSSIVCGQSETNNSTLMTAATIRSLVHRPPPPYSVHLNRNENQLSNTSLNSLQILTHNVSSHVLETTSNISAYSNANRSAHSTAVLRSPAHRPESFSASSSPSHFAAALGSPAHRSDRTMNSLVRSSTVAKSPVHQSESQHKFAVPRKPNKTKIVNSPPVFPLIHTSPSRSVCQNSPVHAPFTNISSMSPDQTSPMNVAISDSSNEASPRASNVTLNSREIPAAATPSRNAMPNLINIRSPVYAPMLFSPPNFVQDEPDDLLDGDGEGPKDNCGKDSGSEDILETIDLTWLDDVDEEQIQKEIDFIAIKKEEPDEGEVILNQEQFPVVPSPADSGIASPIHQEECSELVYLHRLCICEGPAEYLCKCRMVMYCSASCQTRDWKDHKIVCLKYTVKNKDNK